MEPKVGPKRKPGPPKGVRVGGRQKGTPNKTTASVKAALEEAFVTLGGVPALAIWGADNLTEFYKLYAKLLPVQIAGDPDGAPIVQRIENVIIDHTQT